MNGPDHAPINGLWKSLRLAVELIVLFTVVAYIPAIRGGFIWDDDDHLTQNPAVAAPDGLRPIWSSLAVARYYPLTLTSFWVQRRLWGLNPLPYHMVNVVLHAANAVLVFFLLRRLGASGAWSAAALWAIHPVCVESVAWVTELKNTQSGLFFLLSLIWYLKADENPRFGTYFWALLFGVAAMLSKPSTVALPAVCLLMVWWRRGRWQWSDGLRTVPLFVFAAGMSALTIIEQRKEIFAGTAPVALGLSERISLPARVVWFYLGKLVWPSNLTFIYPRWNIPDGFFLDWGPWIGIAAAAAALWRYRRDPWAHAGLFGLAYFALLLVPVAGVFDVYFFRYSFVADHFQYLASIGPVALAACAGADLCARAGPNGRRMGRWAVAVAVTILGVLTWKQATVYGDVVTLWRDTLAKNPGCWMAYNNLGVALNERGLSAEAIDQYQQALRVRPGDPEVYYNWGNALVRQGKVAEAIDRFEQALQIRPDYRQARNNLGNALARQGQYAEAIEQYLLALRMNPDDSQARNNLGYALLRTGKVTEAIEQYNQALQIKPDYVEARSNLGDALLRQDKLSEAIAQYRQVLKFEPDWPHALTKLGWILATNHDTRLRNGTEAVRYAERLCEITNDQQPDALDLLGAAYAETGRFDDAAKTARQALELAKSTGQNDLANRIQERLKSYETGHPYREPSPP